jgi:hypothetical protein
MKRESDAAKLQIEYQNNEARLTIEAAEKERRLALQYQERLKLMDAEKAVATQMSIGFAPKPARLQLPTSTTPLTITRGDEQGPASPLNHYAHKRVKTSHAWYPTSIREPESPVQKVKVSLPQVSKKRKMIDGESSKPKKIKGAQNKALPAPKKVLAIEGKPKKPSLKVRVTGLSASKQSSTKVAGVRAENKSAAGTSSNLPTRTKRYG